MFDIATLLIGTVIITVIAMAFAAPIGLLSAIYLSEYASPRTRAVIKPVLEVLASIPSVVLGFFALTFINPPIVQQLVHQATVFNMLAAGLGVGVLIIPLIASISEDALRAVPRSLREASYGLGARKVTDSLRVVVPAAVSGIVAALIIGVSRAIGETMVVAIAAGGTGGSLRTFDPLGPGQTITGAIASLATGSDQSQAGDGRLPQPVLPGPAAVRHHPGPQHRRVTSSCVARGSGTRETGDVRRRPHRHHGRGHSVACGRDGATGRVSSSRACSPSACCSRCSSCCSCWSADARSRLARLRRARRRLPDRARCRRTRTRRASARRSGARFWIGVIVVVVAFPLGVATAVYLEEYAPAVDA